MKLPAPCRCLLLVLAALLALPALAFAAMRTDGGLVIRAPRSPWPVFLQADPIDKLSVNKVQAVTLAAIKAWNDVAAAEITLKYAGLVRQPPRFGVYIALDRQFVWEGSDGTARTVMEWGSDGGFRQVNIRLNGVDFQWVTGTATTKADPRSGADLQSVLTHQLGHALGLGHSRDATATMYFWGTSKAGRTLTVDDARGLQFLYPAGDVTASATCEPCRSDADCAGTSHCLAWPDGYAYCAAACASHADCPVGSSCGTYGGGTGCLPNDGHCSADRALAHYGEACAADAACDGASACMPVASGQGFCTVPCASSFACPVGSTCTANGYCTEHGDRPDGATCRVPGDCVAAACLASALQTGTCGRACSGSCGGGEVCGDDGFCRLACSGGKPCPDGQTCSKSGVCRGPLPLGWPCGNSYDCGEGTCVALTGAKFEAVCTWQCESPTDCPAGTGCAKTGKGKLCVPGFTLAPGGPCSADAMCGTGMACDKGEGWGGYGRCATACDPFGDSAECAGGWCVWAGGATAKAGICRDTAGGGVPGQGCSATAPCRADLVCAGTDGGGAGRGGGGAGGGGAGAGGQGVCARSCDPAGTSCPVGLACVPLGATTMRGVCLDGGSGAVEIPAVDATPYVNAAARAVALPQVVPVAAFRPPAPPPPPVIAARGCSSAAGARPPVAWAVVLVCLGWAVVRGGGRRIKAPRPEPAPPVR